jgi:hypothetical protein
MNKQFEFGEDVSGNMKRKLTSSKHDSSFAAILIAQLARAD